MTSLLSGNDASIAAVPSIYPDQNTNENAPATSYKTYEPPPLIGLSNKSTYTQLRTADGKPVREFLPMGMTRENVIIMQNRAISIGKKYSPEYSDQKAYMNTSKTILPNFEWVVIGKSQVGWRLGDL
jgi:hypothetical protein